MKTDNHRKVKIDYSVLRQFLSLIVDNDGVANWDTDNWKWSCREFPQDLKEKAQHILDNS